MPNIFSRRHLRIMSFVIASLVAMVTHATSIQQISFEDMANDAEFIFEGSVTASRSEWNSAKTHIYTYITFSVDDVLKGDFDEESIELRFSGGEIDDAYDRYAGLVYPKLNESGIYFVETLTTNLINPLIGWSQGHFKINAAGEMVTNKDIPVLSMAVKSKSADTEFSGGIAQGVQTKTSPAQTEPAMGKTQFKQQLRDLLKEQ